MNKKTLLLVGGGIAVAGVAWYFLNNQSAATALPVPAPTDPGTDGSTDPAATDPTGGADGFVSPPTDYHSFMRHVRRHPHRTYHRYFNPDDGSGGTVPIVGPVGDNGGMAGLGYPGDYSNLPWWKRHQINMWRNRQNYGGGNIMRYDPSGGSGYNGYGGRGYYNLPVTQPGNYGDAPPPLEVLTGQSYGGNTSDWYYPYANDGYAGSGYATSML